MIERIIFPSKEDTGLESIGKGFLLGGILASSAYGLQELKSFLLDKIKKPKVFPDDEPLAFTIKKKSSLDKVGSGSILSNYMLGLSLPLGAYGAINLIKAIKDREEVLKLKSKFRQLEEAIKGEAKVIDKPEEIRKMSEDKELNDFVDGLEEELKKEASVMNKKAWNWPWSGVDVTDTADMLFNKMPLTYLPAVAGILSGLGLLSGYHGARFVMNPESRKIKDILKPPTLSFTLEEAVEEEAAKKKVKEEELARQLAEGGQLQ